MTRSKKLNTRNRKYPEIIIAEVKSESMAPIIRKGDKIMLKRIYDIHVGDVVGYVSHFNIPIVHRVVKVKDRFIRTMADSNFRMDAAVYKTQIIGKLEALKIDGKWKKYQASSRRIDYLDLIISYLSKVVNKLPNSLVFYSLRQLTTKLKRYQLENTL